MSFYICKKISYGKNGNLTRWEILKEYSEDIAVQPMKYSRKWCWYFIGCIVCLIVVSFYFEYKSEGCMTDGQIQEYFQEHAP